MSDEMTIWFFSTQRRKEPQSAAEKTLVGKLIARRLAAVREFRQAGRFSYNSLRASAPLCASALNLRAHLRNSASYFSR
jgi:hypothetical protein